MSDYVHVVYFCIIIFTSLFSVSLFSKYVQSFWTIWVWMCFITTVQWFSFCWSTLYIASIRWQTLHGVRKLPNYGRNQHFVFWGYNFSVPCTFITGLPTGTFSYEKYCINARIQGLWSPFVVGSNSSIFSSRPPISSLFWFPFHSPSLPISFFSFPTLLSLRSGRELAFGWVTNWRWSGKTPREIHESLDRISCVLVNSGGNISVPELPLVAHKITGI